MQSNAAAGTSLGPTHSLRVRVWVDPEPGRYPARCLRLKRAGAARRIRLFVMGAEIRMGRKRLPTESAADLPRCRFEPPTRSLRVQVHYHPDLVEAYPVPQKLLKSLFASVGVALQFTEAQVLERSLVPTVISSFDRILSRLLGRRPNGKPNAIPGDPVHFFVLKSMFIESVDALGSVVNEDRGAAAVFVEGFRSSGAGPLPPDDFLQICAHELGHLLNLTHEDSEQGVSTAMDQFDHRRGPPESAWRAVLGCDSGLPCYPFATKAIEWLKGASDQDWKPWGSRFRGGGIPGVADVSSKLRIRFRSESRILQVGDPLAWSLSVTNRRSRSACIPVHLSATSGDLGITVVRPDGTTYEHTPNYLVHSDRTASLRPGGRRIYRGLLHHGLDNLLFPIVGRYRFEVRLRDGSSNTAILTVRVVAARDERPTSKPFARMFAHAGGRLTPSARKSALQYLQSGSRGSLAATLELFMMEESPSDSPQNRSRLAALSTRRSAAVVVRKRARSRLRSQGT